MRLISFDKSNIVATSDRAWRSESEKGAMLTTPGKYESTRSLGALRAPTSRRRPFGPLDFVLRALQALRPCDPRNNALLVKVVNRVLKCAKSGQK